MKIYGSVLAVGILQALAWGSNAFTVQGPVNKAASAVVLRAENGPSDVQKAAEAASTESDSLANMSMYPINPTFETMQGGKTVRTYQMPPWADKCQMSFKTNGRPLRCTAQVWIGPLRTTHTVTMNNMNGQTNPYLSTITFKKLAPAIRVITGESFEMPIEAAVWVPPPDRAEKIGKKIKELWDSATPGDQKKLIQGADVSGGIGAVRTWEIPANVKSVQVISWSKDTSKKSLKARIEVLQGPNNKKQDYDLQCGGSTQPLHAVF
jgi:hypothetical protein